jgi:MYXO-CTERM domain-containing protein
MGIGSGCCLGAVLLGLTLTASAAAARAPLYVYDARTHGMRSAAATGYEFSYEASFAELAPDDAGAAPPAAAPPPLRPTPAQPVPEPSGWVMLVAGVAALATLQRRRPPLFK